MLRTWLWHWAPSRNFSAIAAARLGSPGSSTASAISPGSASMCGVGAVMLTRCSALADDETHRLFAGGDARAEQPPDGRGHRGRPGLADAPHGHAQVLGLDHHHHALGLQRAVDLVRDLDGQLLLDLRPPGVGIDQASELGQPGDLPVVAGDVGHVRPPDEGDEMMFTDARGRDVADHDHLVVAGLEGGGQVRVGLFVQARADLGVHAGDPLRGVAQSLTVGLLAHRLQDLAHRLGDAVEVHRRGDGRELTARPLLDHARAALWTRGRQVPEGRGSRSPQRSTRRQAGSTGARVDHTSGWSLASATVTAGSRGAGRAVPSSSSSIGTSMPAPLSMSPKTWARSASSSVSFSTNDVARRSSVARWVLRMKRARSWAPSISRRTSSSMKLATSSE